jgi:large subunit ribosomal protein LP0
MSVKSEKGDRKQSYFGKLIDLINKYNQILIVSADNVGSTHMQNIRRSLRGKAELLMGKNTMIRKAIKGQLEKNPGLEVLQHWVRGNVGFVFTAGDLKEIRDEISNNRVSAGARVGSIAPCDVFLPAGNTALDPSQTNFMQALNIATRINKGTIEIINQVHLIKKGEKVGSSEATLLQKLDIRPFFYGLIPVKVYKDGSVFEPSVLDITDNDIIEKFSFGIKQLAALSLQINVPTIAAVPHYFATAYKNILAISLATDYTFERADKLKKLLSDPEALKAAQLAATASTTNNNNNKAAPDAKKTEAKEEKKAAPKEEPKEEEEEGEGGFGDLFG